MTLEQLKYARTGETFLYREHLTVRTHALIFSREHFMRDVWLKAWDDSVCLRKTIPSLIMSLLSVPCCRLLPILSLHQPVL